MIPRRLEWLKRLPALFEIPAPDPERARHRIELMERNAMLPVKLVFGCMIFSSFNFHSLWMTLALSTLDVTVEAVKSVFIIYIVLNLLLALPILAVRRIPLAALQWTVVTSTLTDGLLLAGVTLITGGLDSILYWLFIGLIVRNAASIPPGFSQLFVNFTTSLFYVLMALLDATITNTEDETTRRALGDTPHEEIGELFFLRLLVLWLVAITSYGVQAFLERQRLAMEEAREFAAREGQLHSAGRLAAEFAHQIKNPLAVIRNTAHSLQRAVRENKNPAPQQIEIIQEEVARADRVITQIMGYAQLSEGRVEKLDVVEKLNEAVRQVFPDAVPTGIKVKKTIRGPFPPLIMQRGHLSEILVNLLQNAREALGNKGLVTLAAESGRDQSVVISVADDGPGIPPDKREKIFEAYFTTKEKGTGLGLAIVKHNAELYGGTVRLETEVGKGARFVVIFPAKSLPKPFAK
ncbi:MAG TPA: HAMP domain-containing sensor histidine kinase [Candidatus Sulfotelmatobacter sp.]|jgi:signal transduction histidine kinase|nr:HAMP domain-containing sensor histidine kinase [Candidatus Sulfotelmatobacter sp.]